MVPWFHYLTDIEFSHVCKQTLLIHLKNNKITEENWA